MLNLLNVRTPGVYIDEVPKFPPSIAAVETAIPAFIGYTQLDSYNGINLVNKTTRVDSMVDFETIFGLGPKINIIEVDLDANNAVKKTNVESTYYLYDSMRMYFRNGGGKCYVISLGKYPDTFADASFQTGVQNAINALEKEDEPTLILFPDGVKLTSTSILGSLQALVLVQCEKYKDRFLLADVKKANPLNDSIVQSDILNFKNGIGSSNLQFGAAYYPYLKVNLPRQVRYRDVKGTIKKLGIPINWVNDFINASDAETIGFFNDLNNLVDDNNTLNTVRQNYINTLTKQLEEQFLAKKQEFINAYAAAVTGAYTNPLVTTVKTKFAELFDYLFDFLNKFMDQLAKNASPPLHDPALTTLRTLITNTLRDNYAKPLNLVDRFAQATTIVNTAVGVIQSTGGRSWGFNGWSTEITNTTALTAGDLTGYTFTDPTGAADANKRTVDNLKQIVDKNADTIFAGINSANNGFLSDMAKLEAVREDAILKRIPVLNSVLNFVRSEAFLLPPTGAVAGIYARVDNNRGVWKAPANESIINVVAPSVLLTHDQHGELNVDPSTGKSINVIRSFVGKGNLVWGARTMAGNDNEWRYVNVRRLFNMIEESSKKATEQFVFESNDANTWVKVQAMIENFLTTLWRQGAFFGATAEKAFYVQVGLNKTMTQLDILEGRMIVEVGVAANRPAEFIILRFSHKLPEA